MKEIKDGWYTVYCYDVYVEGGKVLRGVCDNKTTHPYRRCRTGGWDNDTCVSLSAFRSGVARGTKIML